MSFVDVFVSVTIYFLFIESSSAFFDFIYIYKLLYIY